MVRLDGSTYRMLCLNFIAESGPKFITKLILIAAESLPGYSVGSSTVSNSYSSPCSPRSIRLV